MKRLFKEKRAFKKSSFLLFIIIVISLFFGIGYAQISNINLEISGDATLEAEKKVVITDIKYVSSNNAIESQSSIGEPYLTLMNSTIKLGDTLDSSITYKIKVKNNSSMVATYNEAIYSTEQGYDNENISFDIDGIFSGDVLNPKETIEFTITFRYAEGTTSTDNNVLNSIINFKFDIDEKTAKINDIYYDTLQEAIKAVPKNNKETTVELLKDTSETLIVSENQNIVFILNNYMISNNGNNPIIENKGIIKISDGIIASSAETKGAINNQSGGNIVISGGKILVTGGRQALYNNGGTAEITGSAHLESSAHERAAVHNLANSSLIITGGTIISTGSYGVTNEDKLTIGTKDGNPNESTPIIQGIQYGVNSTNNKKISFYNGTIKGTEKAINDDNLIDDIEDNYNIANSEEEIGNILYKTIFLAETRTVTFNPNSGTVTETTRNVAKGKKICTLPEPKRQGYEFIGWYTEPSGGEEISKNTIISEDKTFYAHWESVNYAEINGIQYAKIQDAINAIPTSGETTTIIILRDAFENFTTKTGQNIVIDLKGYTLENSNNNAVIENYSTTRIENGTIKSKVGSATINNNPGANLTIDNVTINASGGKQAIYNLENGIVTITGNSYISSEATGKPKYSDLDRGTIQNLANGTINIISGTIISTKQQAISNEGTLSIGTKNGSINNSTPIIQGENYGLVNSSTANFYDGKIKGILDAISGTITDTESTLGNGTEIINNKSYKVQYNE